MSHLLQKPVRLFAYLIGTSTKQFSLVICCMDQHEKYSKNQNDLRFCSMTISLLLEWLTF